MQPNLDPDRTLDGGNKNNEFRAEFLLCMEELHGRNSAYFRRKFCALPTDLQLHAHSVLAQRRKP